MKYEDIYKINRDMFNRLWIKKHSFISKENPSVSGNSFRDRYCSIRAAMDNDGVDFVLRNMIENNWSHKNRSLACLAWSNHLGIKNYVNGIHPDNYENT